MKYLPAVFWGLSLLFFITSVLLLLSVMSMIRGMSLSGGDCSTVLGNIGAAVRMATVNVFYGALLGAAAYYLDKLNSTHDEN